MPSEQAPMSSHPNQSQSLHHRIQLEHGSLNAARSVHTLLSEADSQTQLPGLNPRCSGHFEKMDCKSERIP